jgi:hypothetical protein
VSAFVAVGVIAWLVAAVTGAAAAGVLAAVVVIVTPILSWMHLLLLSEPLYMALLAVTLALLTFRPDRPLAVGVVVAAGAVVRYAGVGVTAACALWMLLRPGRPAERLRRAFLAGLPTVLALGVVALSRGSDEGVVRRVGVYGSLAQNLAQGLSTLRSWLITTSAIPAAQRWALTALALSALAVLLVGMARDLRRDGATIWPTAPDAANRMVPHLRRPVHPARLPDARPGGAAGERGAGRDLLALARAAGPPGPRPGGGAARRLDLRVGGGVERRGALRARHRAGRVRGPARPLAAARVGAGRGAGLRAVHQQLHRPLLPRRPRVARAPARLDSATVRALGRRLAERGGAVVMFRTPKTLVPRPFMTERKMRPYVEALGLREAARYEDGVVWVAGGE